MVKEIHVEAREGSLELPGLLDVLLSRKTVAGGMIVDDDDLCSVCEQGRLDDRPGMEEAGIVNTYAYEMA